MLFHIQKKKLQVARLELEIQMLQRCQFLLEKT